MTIDRAIEILDPEHRENYDGMEEVNEACRMGMEDLKRSRWIPCRERLPETDGPYLVVNKATGWIGVYNFSRVKNFPYFGPQKNAWWRLDDDWYPQFCNVTHWMPLPKPPKEEQHETD